VNEFREATHEYFIGGKPVPGVTTVLKEAGLIDSTWFTPEAALRGQHVHTACALWDKGELDTCALDPVLVPYLEAWQKFRKESGVTPTIIEEPFYSLEHGFAGTIDRAWMDGKHFIVCDIKSGPLPDWLPLQLAGYSILINAFSGMGVELRDNGSYSVKVVKTADLFKARRLFLCYLERVKQHRRIMNGTPNERDKTILGSIERYDTPKA
jgi:hypothetical protein